MTDWLPLTLICALALAGADVATKRLLNEQTAAELVIIRFVLPAALMVPVLVRHWPSWPDAGLWLWLALALPLEILAMLCYVVAIRDSSLALTLPYLAFTPVFTSLAGFLLLGEIPSRQGLMGILLVVLGAYWLNLGPAKLTEPRSWLAPLAAIRREKGSRYMLGAAIVYSITSVLGKGAMQYMPGISFGPFYFMVLGIFTLLVFAIREPSSIRVIAHTSWASWLVAGLMALMILTHFLALERVETAYMISVKRTSILFGILLGHLFFNEHGVARNLVASGVMVIGVAMIIV